MPKRLLEAGADGYVGKNCDAAELVRAVRTVASGRRYLAGTIAQALALSGVAGAGTPFDALSARELEVAMLLLRGMRQEDIARRLSLSAKTVNTHKSRLFGKLGIRDSIALARMAGRHGLADPLARLNQNFGVLKGQLGFNNPQTETSRFSLRSQLFRAAHR